MHWPAERAVAEVKGAAGAEGSAIALGLRLGLAGALLLGEVLTLTWLVDTEDLHNATGLARITAEAAPALRATCSRSVRRFGPRHAEFGAPGVRADGNMAPDVPLRLRPYSDS